MLIIKTNKFLVRKGKHNEKKYIIFALFIGILLTSSISVFAHSLSQSGILARYYLNSFSYSGYYIGGEEIGWGIDERNHSGGTKITYEFDETDPLLTDEYKDLVRQGASMWSGVVSIEESSNSAVGIITTVNEPGEDFIAQFTDYSSDSSGHLEGWAIEINRAKVQSAKVFAHEFGHVIGLVDLYDDSNDNKLMYMAPVQSSATGPTTQDIWGARVITGQHDSHSWNYAYYMTNSTGNTHIGTCTACGGKAAYFEQCTYNSNNVCTKCGIPYGVQPYALEEEILTE